MLRIIAILLLCFVIVNLFFGLYTLLRDRSGTYRTVRALTLRVVVSILLFALIMVAVALDLW